MAEAIGTLIGFIVAVVVGLFILACAGVLILFLFTLIAIPVLALYRFVAGK